MTRRKAITMTTLTVVTAGLAAVLLGGAVANATPFSCALGGTSLGGGVCELTYTSGSNTFTPPANTSKLEAVLVGGGGNTDPYADGLSGGGGAVVLKNFTDTSAAIDFTVGASHTATTAVQSATTTTANPGLAGESTSFAGGTSGNGNTGANGSAGGGGGAGASTSTEDGGAGLVVSAIAPSGSLFTGDSDCYGGGGAGANPGVAAWGVATCGGGYIQNGTTTVIAPLANTGGGAGTYGATANDPGASGVVVVRWETVSTVTFDLNGHGTAVPAQNVITGTTATRPTAPTAAGATFNGWYTDPALTTPADFSTPITANTTLYASWVLADTGVNPAPLFWFAAILLTIGGAVLLLVSRLRTRMR